jgi:hypothetical protein
MKVSWSRQVLGILSVKYNIKKQPTIYKDKF